MGQRCGHVYIWTVLPIHICKKQNPYKLRIIYYLSTFTHEFRGIQYNTTQKGKHETQQCTNSYAWKSQIQIHNKRTLTNKKNKVSIVERGEEGEDEKSVYNYKTTHTPQRLPRCAHTRHSHQYRLPIHIPSHCWTARVAYTRPLPFVMYIYIYIYYVPLPNTSLPLYIYIYIYTWIGLGT